MDGAELRLGEVFVVMMIFLVVGSKGRESKDESKNESKNEGEEQPPGKTFHERPHECRDEILVTREPRVKPASISQKKTVQSNPRQRHQKFYRKKAYRSFRFVSGSKR